MKKTTNTILITLMTLAFIGSGCTSSSNGPSTTSSSSSSSSTSSSSSSSTSSSSSSTSTSTSTSGGWAPAEAVNLLEVVDLNDDDFLDLVWAPRDSGNVFWYRNNGTSIPSYSKELLVSLPQVIEKIVVADVDSDGDKDLLLSLKNGASYWYENDGAFEPSVSKNNLGANAVNHLAGVKDMNTDTSLDVILMWPEAGTLSLLENSSTLPPGFAAKTIVSDVSGISDVDIANLDGDGDFDIVLASLTEKAIYWYENDGQLSPNFSQRTVSADAEDIYSLSVKDIDSDGDMDILSASYSERAIVWHRNNGELVPSFIPRVISNQIEGIYWLAIEDLDNDGDQDLLAASSVSNTISWFENDGTANPLFTERLLASVDSDTYAIRVADIDDDGDLDVVLAAGVSTEIAWWKNNGQGVFTEQVTSFKTQSFAF